MTKVLKLPSRESFIAAFESLEFALCFFAKDGIIAWANPAFASLLSLPQAALPGTAISDYFDELAGDLGKHLERPFLATPSGAPSGNVLELRIVFTGAEFVLQASSAGGATTAQSQRLESLGILASTVAHDLNNILTSVLGHVSFLRLCATAESSGQDSVVAIEDGARRAAAITQRILEFARGQHAVFVPVNVCELIQSIAKLLQGSLPEGVKLTVNTPDHPVYVLGAEEQLSQVIVNLAMNARDALKETGEVKIVARFECCNDAESCRHYGVHPGDFIIIEVTDDGHGIPPDLKERIFEPFFTTKLGRGTGLGLAIVASVVKLHGGVISIESAPESGSCFTLALPSCSADESVARNDLEEQLPGGSEKILVVDDEEAVRTIVQRSLEHLGYEVVVASSGREALKSYAVDPSSFQLVIIDMIMPQMAGDELFNELQAINRKVPVLIASGYSSDSRMRHILSGGGLGFIQKPFAVEELAREVRRCLDLVQAHSLG